MSPQKSYGKPKKFCNYRCGVNFQQKKNAKRTPVRNAWVFTGFVKVPERNFTIPLDRYMDSATLIEMKRLEADEA